MQQAQCFIPNLPAARALFTLPRTPLAVAMYVHK